MRRSVALLCLVGAVACTEHAASSVTGNNGATGGSDTVFVTANPANVGAVIPSNFMGLSFDPFTLQVTANQNKVPPTSLVSVMKSLGAGVVRINAGDYCHTSGESWWTAGTRDTRSDGCTVLTGADFDRLFQICGAANWTVIVGVNLAAALPDTFAAEAAFIQARGGSLLTAIEIGNEPDIYPVNGIRAKSYNFAAYGVELSAFLAAMQRRAPGVPIAAPSTAFDTAWLRQTIAQNPSRFALATQHRYATGQDPGLSVGAFNYASIPHLLSDTLRKDVRAFFKDVVASVKPSSLPTRLTELNTANFGGKVGVSDVFASALWALDHIFLAAEAGLAGVHIYAGCYFDSCQHIYSPFTIASDGTLAARPLLYGMLAFQDAGKGQVVNLTTTNSRQWNFSAHGAVTAADGTVRLAFVNDDTVAVPVRVVVPSAMTVTVRRLVTSATISPLSDSTNVTYAGAKVTTAGAFAPAASEAITPTAGAFVVNVPAASGAIVIVTTK